jgi:Uma2 family endonuclease
MVINQHPITIEQFDTFVEHPENANKLFEFVGGEIVEVPSNAYSSKIATRISGYIFAYLIANDIGHLTGEHGGYKVEHERYAPDVAFISYITHSGELDKQGYHSTPPDLAVEVLSSDSNAENATLMVKIGNYLAVGTVVWVVRPDKETIEVYQPSKPVETYRKGTGVSGSDILPDFELSIDDVFKS